MASEPGESGDVVLADTQEAAGSGSVGQAGDGRSLKRKVGGVAAASAVALVFCEVVTLGQTIALARLLSPAEVGVFAAGTMVVLFLGTFAEGGLRAALVQRQRDVAEAAETVFWATMAAGALLSVGMLAASPVIGWIFESREIGLVAAATSGVVFLFALTNVPEAMLQREFSIKRRLIVSPSVAVSFAVVAVVLAALGWGVWSMVIGLYASYAACLITLWWLTDWRPARVRGSIRMWRELARFGFPLIVSSVISRLRSVVEVVVVGRRLGDASLGLYQYGQRISMISVKVIIEVGAFALFPAFSQIAGDQVRLRHAFLRALHLVMIGAAGMSGLMIVVGQPAVVVLFGDQWRGAGAVVVSMAGFAIGQGVASVSEEAIKARGRTSLIHWYVFGGLATFVALVLALVGPFGLFGVGLAVTLTSCVVGAVSLLLAKGVVGFTIGEAASSTVRPLVGATIATIAVGALEHLVLHTETRGLLLGIGLLAVDLAAFAVVYLATLAALTPTAFRALLRRRHELVDRLRSPGSPRAALAVEPGESNAIPREKDDV